MENSNRPSQGKGSYRPRDRRHSNNNNRSNYRGDRNRRDRNRDDRNSPKIDGLIKKINGELSNSIEPISIPELNAFERKLIHRHFDHNPDIVTKTYRLNDEDYELRVYPIGNLKKWAQEQAEQAVNNREKITLPHMSNYERFVVHDALKEITTVKTESHGDGDERHIVIEPDVFGRGLKRMIRKIKLF